MGREKTGDPFFGGMIFGGMIKSLNILKEEHKIKLGNSYMCNQWEKWNLVQKC